MPAVDPTDPDWPRLRMAFDELVDLAPEARPAACAGLGLPATLVRKLERLLAADSQHGAFLAPGQAIALPATPSVAAPSPRSLPMHLGRYELCVRLGQGGMGEVFKARDTELQRSVAIKLLSPHLLADPTWLVRFQNEARTAGGLNHPNVVTVHDVGAIDGQYFLTTEYIEGETLRTRLSRGPMSVAEAVGITTQILAGVARAHEAGIVHRDLKPENVMRRPDGLVKVLDFGLAKATPHGGVRSVDPNRTAAGMLLGTMRYMAPEQARGLPVDARGDVFAIGALLYEMLAGVPAFPGATALDVLVALLEHEPRPLPAAAPGVPAPLAALVAKALQKDPAARFASAAEMAAALLALRLDGAEAGDGVPAVHYCKSGDVNIAYQVFGEGTIDLVFVMGWISHLEWFWREPSFAAFLRRLCTFARVILFDKRGTGLSDRVANDHLPTLEQRMDDVRAVLDEIGSRAAVLCGISEGGPMCALYAATHPERTRGLVMIGSYARRLRTDGYPWGSTFESRARFCDEILRNWGGPVGIAERAPSMASDRAFREWWSAYLRHGASPSAAVALTVMNSEIDVRPVLPTIRVPTLVVHRTGDRCLLIEEGRYLAAQIPGARLVELPGDDHLPFVGDQGAVLRAIEDFCRDLPHTTAQERALATVLLLQVVTPAGADAVAYRDSEAGFRAAAMRETGIADGRSLAFGGGRMLATFDGPARAIRVARELLRLADRHALVAKALVHVGECEVRPEGATGPAIDEVSALVARAAPGALQVTKPVCDLVAGGGFRFAAAPEGPGGMPLFVVE